MRPHLGLSRTLTTNGINALPVQFTILAGNV